MKIINQEKKCAVCGEVNQYSEILSSHNFGYPDLDLKPASDNIGLGIQECPNCHYCNYDISNTIERRFYNNLELWNSDDDFKELKSIENDRLRRVLIVAQQYKDNLDYYEAYKNFLAASWLCEKEEEINKYQGEAMHLFFDKIFNNYIDDILQAVDIFRMNGGLDQASLLLRMLEELYKDETKFDEEDIFKKKIINAERQLISNGDTKRHNAGEFVNKNK